MSIAYAQEQSLSVADYVAVLAETTMRDKRPLANTRRLGEMIAGANFIVTARENGVILGLARCISDGAWVCYCAELAVKESVQGRGIGRQLLQTCWDPLGPRIGFLLISDPTAVGFYEKLGLEREITPFWRERADRS